jgi:hypothetical protein
MPHDAPIAEVVGPARATFLRRGRDGAVLSRVWRRGIAAAVWERSLPPSVADWLDGLAPAAIPSLRSAATPDDVAALVAAACEDAGPPAVPARAWLAADAAALAAIFARIVGTEALRLRLEVISGDACRRFHVDDVPARLLCTYRGRGTEFARADAGGTPLLVDRLATGEVAILRGRRWPGDDATGLLHRSPPLEGTGETRLLLVLDAAQPDDGEW